MAHKDKGKGKDSDAVGEGILTIKGLARFVGAVLVYIII